MKDYRFQCVLCTAHVLDASKLGRVMQCCRDCEDQRLVNLVNLAQRIRDFNRTIRRNLSGVEAHLASLETKAPSEIKSDLRQMRLAVSVTSNLVQEGIHDGR